VAASTYGEEHPFYATWRGYLGVLYEALSRPSEAEPLFKRALVIKEKSFGSEHTEIADALHTLAEFYRKQGRLSEAEPLYQRVLSISEKALGPEHPSIGIVLGNLAELYRAKGRDVDAEPLTKRSDAIREKWAVAARPVQGSGADEPARPSASPSSDATFGSDEVCEIRPTKEICPAKRCGIVLVVTDIWIGAGIEQQRRDVDGTALDGHVQRNVIAVPHQPFRSDVDACEQPANCGRVLLVDRKVQANGVFAFGADPRRVGAQHRLGLVVATHIDRRQEVEPGAGRQ
jgi:tetratricopeptide (TPR) repeat protein